MVNQEVYNLTMDLMDQCVTNNNIDIVLTDNNVINIVFKVTSKKLLDKLKIELKKGN